MNKFWTIVRAIIDGLHKLVLTFWRLSYTARNMRKCFA